MVSCPRREASTYRWKFAILEGWRGISKIYQPLAVEKGLPWKIPNSWSFWLISYIDRVSNLNLNLAKTKTWDSVAYLLLLLRVGGAVHIGSHDENRDGEGEKDKRILGAGQKTKFAIGSNRDIQGGGLAITP